MTAPVRRMGHGRFHDLAPATLSITTPPERASAAPSQDGVRPAAPASAPVDVSDARPVSGAGAFLLLSPFAAGMLTGWLVGVGGCLIGIGIEHLQGAPL